VEWDGLVDELPLALTEECWTIPAAQRAVRQWQLRYGRKPWKG